MPIWPKAYSNAVTPTRGGRNPPPLRTRMLCVAEGFEPVCLFQGRLEWRRLHGHVLGDTNREIHLTAVLLESHSCTLRSMASGETQALEGYPIDVGWYGRMTGRSGRRTL